ncbi:MAG: hypothetical protein ACRD21_25855 [Vicinamibacteria bacterium]
MGILLVSFLAISSVQPVRPARSDRERQYLNLAQATIQKPIRHEELRDALLSPAAVDSIRRLFERSLEESLPLEDTMVTPELGGEATLESGTLVFVLYPDPIHPVLREMVKLREEPAKLLSFLESTADGRDILAKTGGLHALLFQITRQPPTPAQLALLETVTSSAVAAQFKTWSADPKIQAEMIETTDWRGRYVGFWHIHPPRIQGREFSIGIEPSVEDMQNAIELGQFLTLVFQPDGFDAYDLSEVAVGRRPDLKRARVVRYRSPDWKPLFEEKVRSLQEE